MPYRLAAIVGVLALAFGTRLAYLFELQDGVGFSWPVAGHDAALYQDLARRVADGDLALGSNAYHYSPIYAYWLGAVYALFGDGPWVARLANVILGTASSGLIALLALAWFRSRAVALITGIVVAVYGPLVVIDTSALPSTFGLFFTASGLWLIERARTNGRLRTWLAAGAALGVALHVFAALWLLLIGLGLWLVTLGPGREVGPSPESWPESWPESRQGSWRQRDGAIAAAALVLGSALVIAPFTARNVLVANEWLALSSNAGIHFYIGNHDGANGTYSPVPGVRPNPAGHQRDARRLAETRLQRELSHRETSAYWRSQALTFVRENPQQALQLLGRKLLLAVNAYEIPNELNYAYLQHYSPLLANLPAAGLLLPLALAGLAFALPRARATAPGLLLGLAMLAGLAATFVTWEYRLPLLTVLMPMAAFSTVSFVRWWRARRWTRLAPALALLSLAGVLVHRPAIDAQQREHDFKFAAYKLRETAARAELHRTLDDAALSPRARVQSISRLAAIHLQARDFEGAVAIFEAAIRDEPGQLRYWQGLGQAASRLRDEQTVARVRAHLRAARRARAALPRHNNRR